MSESMREEFEAWLDSAGFEVRRYHHIDGYHGNEQMAAWGAWQASRAALCVELPKIVNSEWACTSDECAAMRDAIRFCKKPSTQPELKRNDRSSRRPYGYFWI